MSISLSSKRLSQKYVGKPPRLVRVKAIGGTITTSGSYKVHTFTSTGKFRVTWFDTGSLGSMLFGSDISFTVVGGGMGGHDGFQSSGDNGGAKVS